MAEDRSLASLIRDALTDFPNNENDTIAIEVMNRLRVPVKASRVLVPAVAGYVGSLRRNEAHDVERRAFKLHALGSSRAELPDMEPVDLIALRRQALKELHETTFPELTHLVWADATLEDIDEADSRLGKKERGIAQTRSLLAQARADIVAHGVTCLREIKDAA